MAAKQSKGSTSEHTTPEEYLRLHDIDVGEMVHVWSAGDSDLGCETFIFLDIHRKPKTVVIHEGKLICRDGWNWFNVVYA